MATNQPISSHVVHPWGVEPQSKEPESFILSIELRVPIGKKAIILSPFCVAKVRNIVALQTVMLKILYDDL